MHAIFTSIVCCGVRILWTSKFWRRFNVIFAVFLKQFHFNDVGPWYSDIRCGRRIPLPEFKCQRVPWPRDVDLGQVNFTITKYQSPSRLAINQFFYKKYDNCNRKWKNTVFRYHSASSVIAVVRSVEILSTYII